MTEDEIRYALSKQLRTASAIHTDYGEIWLDEKMRMAIYEALKPILEGYLTSNYSTNQ